MLGDEVALQGMLVGEALAAQLAVELVDAAVRLLMGLPLRLVDERLGAGGARVATGTRLKHGGKLG